MTEIRYFSRVLLRAMTLKGRVVFVHIQLATYECEELYKSEPYLFRNYKRDPDAAYTYSEMWFIPHNLNCWIPGNVYLSLIRSFKYVMPQIPRDFGTTTYASIGFVLSFYKMLST